jgi:serine O-acetyltransferase
MEILNKEYIAFKKMVLNDYPYEVVINDNELFPVFKHVYNNVCDQHSKINNKFFSREGKGIIDFKILDHYLIFSYRIANYIYKNCNNFELQEAIYYSSRIRTSTDLYYTAEIGDYFIPGHSIGTVMDSRAKYGELFKVYNGVHIGPYNIQGLDPKNWKHPKFGNGVTLLAKSSVYGDTDIGDNVIISVGSLVVNEKIPSNCIVIGQSPKLNVLPNNQSNFDLLNKPN